MREGDGVVLVGGLTVIVAGVVFAPTWAAFMESLTNLQQAGVYFLGFLAVMLVMAFATGSRGLKH